MPDWLKSLIDEGAVFAHISDETREVERLSVATSGGGIAARPGTWIIWDEINNVLECQSEGSFKQLYEPE